ncbi:MAG: polyribonucleotide nucleotidyltransferase, partial [Candidatus Subteraquimicrobiales bacterium]|nr:polyribonucleotide nucleotidyltransferase [Candidatus Subteraquimicrobiales bacterium]
MREIIKEEIFLDGKTVSIETGQLARQANGSILVKCEDTVILVTAVSSEKFLEEIDFFPLTVDVEEKMFAVGKIPGGYIKREGRPSEKSILTARLIDRSIRPSFPKGYRNEVQI